MSNKPILVSSRFKPARGGHAPSDLRDAFLSAVEDLRRWAPGKPVPFVEVRERRVLLDTLCGLLWNCTDALPSSDGSEVWSFVERYGDGYEAGRRASSSYGRAARTLKAIFEAGAKQDRAA